jgi:glutathione S-transferase
VTRILHDLVCIDDRRPSPFCWRIKYALAHKGLAFEARPVGFTEIPRLCGGGFKTVPILEDDGRVIHDSWAIADHLDAAYPERPLFASPAERGLCRFTEAWLIEVFQQVFPIYVGDIHDHTLAGDRAYFRDSRERRLGRTLEEVTAGREARIAAARASLGPLRLMLQHQGQRFMAGEQAGFADYMTAGVLLWISSVATIPLLAADDPIVDWFNRMRGLYGGLGYSSPTYAIAG